MSAHACPICEAPKDQTWHLVCRPCWAKVPYPTQERLFALYKRDRGSDRHRQLCHQILRGLYQARRTALGEQARNIVRRVQA